MTVLKFIKLSFFSLLFLFSLNSFSQFSKTHYIPPIPTTGDGSSTPASNQYIYISTPSEDSFNVTINPVGGTSFEVPVSNADPYELIVTGGESSQLFINAEDTSVVYDNKGYIIEGPNLFYVTVKFFAGGSYQAAGLVSKGESGLGTEFRVGTFENLGTSQDDYVENFLNFVSVIATTDNTIINFSEFGNGVTIVNGINPPDQILLDRGESYILSIKPCESCPYGGFEPPFNTWDLNSNNENGLIGTLVQSNKPIVVNSGSLAGSNINFNDNGISGQDAGIDQLVGADKIGNEYIFVRGLGPDEIERPLIVAHVDNTDVFINGNFYQTIAFAGEYISIPTSFYNVSYPSGNYQNDPSNVNADTDLTNNEPPTGVSSNMYVNTTENVFAYQVIGGIRAGSPLPWFGGTVYTSGVANQGMFFVPPLNCKTPKSVDNIPYINQIGTDEFTGDVTIITESGSELLSIKSISL